MTTTSTDVVVVKVGTSSVTTPNGQVDQTTLRAIARDVATLRARGVRLVVVTSGAITAGWAAVGAGAPRPKAAETLQAVSAVGQPLLMNAWRDAFSDVDLPVGQVLVAPLDFADRRQYLKARSTLHELWKLGVIPIVNENDAVADEEIRFGDNDRLAALVANLVGANRLVLLTDTEGLFTADPRLDATATLIEEVVSFDASQAVAGESRSGVGSGGMASKVAAAQMASWSGVTTVIAAARAERALVRATEGEGGFGTTVRARADRLSARATWIAFASPARGTLTINDGAAAALRHRASLLKVGVISRSGTWLEGDAVAIVSESGAALGKGLARVSSEQWSSTTESVIIHVDDLVISLGE